MLVKFSEENLTPFARVKKLRNSTSAVASYPQHRTQNAQPDTIHLFDF
jgi:hypothetical protein